MNPAFRAHLAVGFGGFGAMLVAFGIGRFGYPPLIPALIAQGWYDPAGASFAGAANLLGYGLGVIAAPWSIRRIGAFPVMALGLALGVLAFAASAWPLPVMLFAALRALSGLSGGLIMIAVPPGLMARVPPALRGRINGLAFTGIGSGFLFSGTVVPLLAAHDLTSAWFGLTAMLVVASLMALFLVPRVPAPAATQASPTAAAKPGPGLWLSPLFLGLIASYGASAAGYVPHTILFVDYIARTLGHGLATGGLLWGLAGLVAFCGPLLTGALADKTSFAVALRLCLILMGGGALLPLVSDALPVLAVSIMLVGGLMPSCGALAAGRTREVIGPQHQASAWALVTLAFAAGQVGGGYALSFLLTLRPDPLLAFACGGGAIIVGLVADGVLTLVARHKKTRPGEGAGL